MPLVAALRSFLPLVAAGVGTLTLLGSPLDTRAQPAECHAASGPLAAQVVELYTSEGCNSCPPADRWLGTLGDGPTPIALGFHVDYWDSLGWKDRFASPAYTHRQALQQRSSGAGYNYTPQVLVDGRDWRRWPGLPGATRPATVAIQLARRGTGVELAITPLAGAPARLGGYLAVVDDGLLTRVGAGENRGETLRHDHVVRALVELAPSAGHAPLSALLQPVAPALEAGARRHWVAVALDADSGLPLQALALACSP